MIIEELIGRTPILIKQEEDEVLNMYFEDGSKAKWFHRQDCCESVTIDDVIGDWSDLLGHPLLVAEERTNEGEDEDGYGTETWTFYTFRSIGGSVDVKWYGSSNGYYSESVDFEFEDKVNS